ncbi:Mannan endo-1,4-beta-mannosidase [compost metagenome]
MHPINPNASLNAQKLLNYLYTNRGNILSGNHNWINNPTGGLITVYGQVGKYPAVHGMEAGIFDPSYTSQQVEEYRHNLVSAAHATFRSGGIITMMMHHSYPGAARTWANVQRRTTQEEFNLILTPGTPEHAAWLQDIDEVAESVLKPLRDLDVPVLWRPYHEMNGQWFWWGCKNNYVQLWYNMYDRYVNHHKLDNLLWVWNANAPNGYTDSTGLSVFEYDNPGIWVTPSGADVFAIDVYNNDYKAKYYSDLKALSQGKIIALGETGRMPSLSILDSQPDWSWFMVWPDYWTDTPASERLAIYSDSRVITKDQVAIPNYTPEYHPPFPASSIDNPPTATGQLAISDNNAYISVNSTDWKPITQDSIILQSPDKSRFRLVVDNEGNLSAEPLTILKDTFNRPSSNTSAGIADTGHTYSASGDAFDVQQKMLYAVRSYNNAILLADLQEPHTKFRASVDVIGMLNLLDPTRNAWETTYNNPHLVFKALSATDLLYAQVFNGKASIGRMSSGTAASLVSVDFPTENGKWYNLSVVVDGAHISLYVDGEFVIDTILYKSDYQKYMAGTKAGVRLGKSGAMSTFIVSPYWRDLLIEKSY